MKYQRKKFSCKYAKNEFIVYVCRIGGNVGLLRDT